MLTRWFEWSRYGWRRFWFSPEVVIPVFLVAWIFAVVGAINLMVSNPCS